MGTSLQSNRNRTRRSLRRTRWFGTVAIVALLAASATTQASVLSYGLTYEYSGATPPEGASPWITATFDDEGTPGSVELRLESTNLTDSESVFTWLFNLDPTLDPTALVFSTPIKTGSFSDPTINLGVDAFHAAGDGYYDVEVAFVHAGPPTRFGVGDSANYTITGIPTLTAGSFGFLSAPGGGHGPFSTVAHIGAIGPNDEGSGWVTTPEPASMVLLTLGVLYLCGRRRIGRSA